jgi:hypothetical protein
MFQISNPPTNVGPHISLVFGEMWEIKLLSRLDLRGLQRHPGPMFRSGLTLAGARTAS